jgi:hypothetical protein
MVVADYGKMGLLLAILLVAGVLGWAGVIAGDTVQYLLVAELGYLTGNGVLARRAQAPSPVLVPKLPDPPPPEES